MPRREGTEGGGQSDVDEEEKKRKGVMDKIVERKHLKEQVNLFIDLIENNPIRKPVTA